MNKFYNKKRIMSLCISMTMIFSILFGGYSPIVVNAEDGNLFANGGVENWTEAKPAEWNGKFESASKATDKTHSGSNAIKHVSQSKTKDISMVIENIVPGQEYSISYWYYDNDPAAKTRRWMAWKNDSTYLDQDKDFLQPQNQEGQGYSVDNDGWVKFETTLIAPEDATKFNFEVRINRQDGQEGGAVYYDDFYFGPVGEVVPSNKVNKVTANLGQGSVVKGTSVELLTSTPGASIYYTIGETTLTTIEGAIKYEEPIVINENTEIHALAVKEGMDNSNEAVFNFTVVSEDGSVKIYEIQGESHQSSYKGQNVKTKGIVTTISKDYYDGGMYIQDQVGDGNNKTSDGIFVRGKVDGVNVGDIVLVEGKVVETYKYPAKSEKDGHLSITEIALKTNTILESGKVLPAPIILGKNGTKLITDNIDNDGLTSFDPQEDAIDLYESLEGMLVKIENPLIVGVEERYGTFHVLADNGEASKDKLSIKGGIIPTKSNFNPEILHIDDVVTPVANKDKVFTDSRFNNAKVGDKFEADITGVMDYNFGAYKIYNTEKLPNVIPGINERETTSVVFDEDKLTVSVYNIENFSADPSHTSNEKVNRIADSIVNDLGAPDIVSLVEVQDNDGPIKGSSTEANKTYERLAKAIVQVGGPEYKYTDIAPVDGADGGQPGGNIRVGYIYRADRVEFNENKGGQNEAATMNGEHLAKNPSRVAPANEYFNATRKSLVGEFVFNGESVFVIANHFCSKRGDAPDFGSEQPAVKGSEPKRHEQARLVNGFVKEILAAKSDANIVVLGDMNDFEFSDTLNILKGEELINMLEELPKNERYSYVYGGNSQVLDNMLVSKNILDRTLVDVVHLNAEFTEHSGRASDHDPVMIQITGLKGENYVSPVKSNISGSEVKVGTSVEFSCEEEGTTIYYTTDDSNPMTNGKEYTQPISLNELGTVTIKAVAKKGDKYSKVNTFEYCVDYGIVSCDVNPGEVVKGTVVKLTVDEENVEIYYSIGEDSNPIEGKIFPTEGLTLDEDTFLKYVLKKDGKFSKNIYDIEYTVLNPEAAMDIAVVKDMKNGDKVKIKGIITAVIGNNAFIQDGTAGIYLYVGGSKKSEFVVENELEIIGEVAEFNNLKQLKNIEEITVISTENVLPKAKVTTIGEIDESVEGLLVTLKKVTIKDIPKDKEKSYSIKVSDGTNTISLRVDKWLEDGINSNDYPVGTVIDVTAPVGQFKNSYQLMLNSSSNITVKTNDEQEVVINSIKTMDKMNNAKDEFVVGSTVVVNAELTANFDAEATVIMIITEENGFYKLLNITKNVELKDTVMKSFSTEAVLENAPVGNYKAKVLVWDSLEGMNPFTEVGEYNFKITN